MHVPDFCADAPCKTKGCCCWSTFGGVKHPDYRNPDEKTVSRLCLNAPRGMVYSRHAGTEVELRQYVQRDVCCLVQDDPTYFSKLPLAEAIDKPTVPVSEPTVDPEDPEDVSTTEMEKVADANIEASAAISDAMRDLTEAAEAMASVKNQGVAEQISEMHQERISKLASSIHQFTTNEEGFLKTLKKHGFQ